MIALVSDNRDAIAELCRQYGVSSLEVFGSATTGAFRNGDSDVDFIVEVAVRSPRHEPQ